jgi:acyl-CoA reductase-like NAD-dependent aldehyde dehydrogenase
MKAKYPYWLAGEAVFATETLNVSNKYSGALATQVSLANAQAIDAGIAAAHASQQAMSGLPPYVRREVLSHCVRRFQERFEEFAQVLCIEAGKPLRDARGEVTRLIDTFRLAAEEATRMGGEVLNLEISPRAKGYRGMTKRVPIGPCSFISPFNFPLNLAAHKIAPAIAAGCTWVLKPASHCPVGALMLGEVLAETELPKGSFSILPAHRSGAELFTTDPRLKLLSFTGSPDVGWALKQKAGKKKVVLELGGNAACLIDNDQHHNLEDVVSRLVVGAFYQSGQSCISVQRIIAHHHVYEAVRDRLVIATRALVAGAPQLEATFIGPMISETEAIRLETWVKSAVRAGARVLCGGQRVGNLMEATVLENVPSDEPLTTEEAFGPVVVLSQVPTFEAGLAEVNASKFGLQAGVFTHDIHRAMLAWDTLEVGGVLINEVPSWRVDNMPYGGVKDSGLGREGVRSAIDDMTEIRLLIVRDAPLRSTETR